MAINASPPGNCNLARGGATHAPAASLHQRNRTRQAILWLNAVDDDKGRQE
jgi:hypothetical protein